MASHEASPLPPPNGEPIQDPAPTEPLHLGPDSDIWQEPDQEPAQNQDPQEERRRRFGFKAGRSIVSSMVVGAASRDLRKGTRHSHHTLHGLDKKTVPNIDPLTGRQVIDAKSGEPAVTTEYSKPFIPVTKQEHHALYTRPKGGESPRAEISHPLLISIRNSVKSGNFRNAAVGAGRIEPMLREVGQSKPGLVGRSADTLLPAGKKRETQLRTMYRDLNKAVYAIVMNPNDEGTPAYEEAEQQNERWKDQLNLYNIQALRARIMEDWAEQDAAPSQANALMRGGGALAVNPAAVAGYFGVRTDKLHEEVPIEVLTKLNFFMTFASNETPPDGLTPQLALYNTDLPEDNTLADIEHIPKFDKDALIVRVRAEAAARVAAEAQAKADRYNKRNSNTTGDSDNSNAGGEARRQPTTQEQSVADYANNPRYAPLFESDGLHKLHQRIQDEAVPLYQAALETINTKIEKENEQLADDDKKPFQGTLTKEQRKVIVSPISIRLTEEYADRLLEDNSNLSAEAIEAVSLGRLMNEQKLIRDSNKKITNPRR